MIFLHFGTCNDAAGLVRQGLVSVPVFALHLLYLPPTVQSNGLECVRCEWECLWLFVSVSTL